MNTPETPELALILAETNRRYRWLDGGLAESQRQLDAAQEAIVDAAKTTRYRGPVDPVLLYSVRDLSRFGAASVGRR